MVLAVEAFLDLQGAFKELLLPGCIAKVSFCIPQVGQGDGDLRVVLAVEAFLDLQSWSRSCLPQGDPCRRGAFKELLLPGCIAKGSFCIPQAGQGDGDLRVVLAVEAFLDLQGAFKELLLPGCIAKGSFCIPQVGQGDGDLRVVLAVEAFLDLQGAFKELLLPGCIAKGSFCIPQVVKVMATSGWSLP